MEVLIAEMDESLQKALVNTLLAGGYAAVGIPDGFAAWNNLGRTDSI